MSLDKFKEQGRKEGEEKLEATKQEQNVKDETFAIMDRRDEEQITRQLTGEVVREFIYEFPVAGKQVIGLSWAGIKECARRMRYIEMSEPKVSENEEEFRVMVKATDTVRHVEMWGAATQSKKFMGKPDIFALAKAVSKSQRNAIRALLPEKLIATLIREALKQQTKKEK